MQKNNRLPLYPHLNSSASFPLTNRVSLSIALSSVVVTDFIIESDRGAVKFITRLSLPDNCLLTEDVPEQDARKIMIEQAIKNRIQNIFAKINETDPISCQLVSFISEIVQGLYH